MKQKISGPEQVELLKITTEAELLSAYEIRRKVFMEEQEVSIEDEFDGYDMESKHFLAYLGGQAAGTARWRYVSEEIKLERFCILTEYRGKGLGRELVKFVMADVLKSAPPRTRVFLHAQIEVVDLYTSLGFDCVGEQFLECKIAHIEMEYNRHFQNN